MTLYDSVIANLKGVVGSKKDGVLLTYLDNEYHGMAGEYIPIKKLGYDTVYEFIRCHQDLFLMQGVGRYCKVFNVVGKTENDATLNLISLIQNTQPKIRRPYDQKPNFKSQPYQGGLKWGYQANYQPNFQTNLQPDYQQAYYQSYYQNAYPTGFQFTIPHYGPSRGFTNGPTYSNNTAAPILPDPTRQTNLSMGFYRYPNSDAPLDIEKESSTKSNLLIPIKCLKSAQVVADKKNALATTKGKSPFREEGCNIEMQTLNIPFKNHRRHNVTLQSLEFVNILIDVFIEYEIITYDNVLTLKIKKDLYNYFYLLTGITIDPIIFSDYVVSSIESPKSQYLYKSLISLDSSKTNCVFNVKSIFNSKIGLPEYDFDVNNEYVIELIKIVHGDLIAFKFPSKMNTNLLWKKEVIPEKTKEIIESQHFWSWLPGSLCLVRLPSSVVRRLSISPVERAFITSNGIASLESPSCQESRGYIVHSTSFYLIDQDIKIGSVLACASSYQELKQKAKENNDTDIAFVCNMSVCAKNTPSKIQFTKLENYAEISPGFIDENDQLRPGTLLVLKNIVNTKGAFHFQAVYSSRSHVYKPVEKVQEVAVIEDVRPNSSKKEPEEDEVVEVIVISDSDEDVPLKVNPPIKVTSEISSYSEKLISTISYSKCLIKESPVTNSNRTFTTEKVALSPVKNSKIDVFEKSICTNPSKGIEIDNKFRDCKNRESVIEQVLTSTPKSANEKPSDVISILSFSESEQDRESLESLVLDAETTVIEAPREICLSNSLINYLENNPNPDRKCLKPLTSDMAHIFSGQVVKLLHIQSGSAVLMVFDSVKIMRREITMMSLRKQKLCRAESVVVGDFFVWIQDNESCDSSDYLLVEVTQIISPTKILANKVHQGLLTIVNTNELFGLPDEKNGDIYGSILSMIGPSIGAFDLHMFPDWFTPDQSFDDSDQLFTAYFVDEDKLVLEYFEAPCRFLNLEMIGSIEKSLTISHCNIKSGQFIEMLSKSLLQCRLFVGSVLEMIVNYGEHFEQLALTKVLSKVTDEDRKSVWFASVLTKRHSDEERYEKMSPHSFIDGHYCIDRVTFDERKRGLRLLEHQNVYIDVPDNFEGLYKFDSEKVQGPLKANEEFYTRYMLAAAAGIPDLKYLHNKLIFDVRAF